MALPAGTKLGRFQLTELLGAGGMGEVYRARDSRLDRIVAIKIIPASLADDPVRLRRFEQEARAAAATNHPNILAVYDIGSDDVAAYIVSELLEGKTLREGLRSGPLPIRKAIEYGSQILRGLAAAHDKGIVHRDLKPDNIFVTGDGQLKILDFGLAKLTQTESTGEEATRTLQSSPGAVVGTAGYMSPEQVRGQVVDKRADLWAFGCILFELLAGQRCFPGDTVADVTSAVIGSEPDWKKLLASTPAEVRTLLRRCLEKDPERRTRNAGDVRLQLDDLLAKLQPKQHTFSRLAVAVGLIAIAVLLAVIFRAVTSRHERLQPVLTQVTFAEGIEEQPAWSPNGQQLLYVATPATGVQRKIFRKDLGAGTEAQLTNGPGDDIMPVWSPDGKRVFFVRSQQADGKLQPGDVFGQYDSGNVWSLDVATGTEALLVHDAYNPSFSPDGKQIAVDASWAGPRRIWVLDAEGHNPQQVTTETSEAVGHLAPRWSPDGQKIAFQNLERTKFDVRVVDLRTKEMHWITNDMSTNLQPVFSPSGEFIYFTSYRSGG